MKTDKNTIIALMSFLLLVKNSSVKAARNISQYPVCINDEVKANKTKYFKLRLSYQARSESKDRPERDLRKTQKGA